MTVLTITRPHGKNARYTAHSAHGLEILYTMAMSAITGHGAPSPATVQNLPKTMAAIETAALK